MIRQLSLTLLFCLLIPCSFARGQPTPPQPDCASNPACAALFKQAQQQFAAGQLADALRTFKLAHAVNADPRLLYSIARLMHVLEQAIEAIPYYRRFIESNLDDPAQKAKAQAEAKQQEAERLEKERLLVASRVEPPPKSTPVYKKWWFWTIVGGAAAAVAVGTAIGVAAREPDLTDVSQYRPFAL
jgi:tetratricopeptide (TPR) repeat protein